MIPTTTQVLAFFNLFAGIMLTASIGLFIGGFIIYLVRLGTWPTYRESAVQLMMWGVSILFTLVLVLAVQQFLLDHLMVAVVIGALIIIALVIWALASSAKPEEKRNGGDRR